VNHRKDRNIKQAKERLTRLSQNGTESGFHSSVDVEMKGQTVPGLKMAPKTSIIICDLEHGKPHGVPLLEVGNSQENPMTQGAEEVAKSKCLPVMDRIETDVLA